VWALINTLEIGTETSLPIENGRFWNNLKKMQEVCKELESKNYIYI